MYRLARELLRRGHGLVTKGTTEDLPRSLDALCLSPVRTITHAAVRTRARSAGSLLVKDNNVLKSASTTRTSVSRRDITGESTPVLSSVGGGEGGAGKLGGGGGGGRAAAAAAALIVFPLL